MPTDDKEVAKDLTYYTYLKPAIGVYLIFDQ
jgi:hypothetical protein